MQDFFCFINGKSFFKVKMQDQYIPAYPWFHMTLTSWKDLKPKILKIQKTILTIFPQTIKFALRKLFYIK